MKPIPIVGKKRKNAVSSDQRQSKRAAVDDASSAKYTTDVDNTESSSSRSQSHSKSSEASSAKIQKHFLQSASEWDLEAAYAERQGRKKKKQDRDTNRLPIKTADGRLQLASAPALANESSDDSSDDDANGDFVDGKETAFDDEDGDDNHQKSKKNKEDKIPDIPEKEQIRQAKEELARLALLLTTEPEEHASAFRDIAKIGESRLPAIQKLTLATQLAIYKDVIPGYRIRPHGEQPRGELLSKDVRKLHNYEQTLVATYHTYILRLTSLAKAPSPKLPSPHAPSNRARKLTPAQALGTLAVTCACTLLNAVPHFNFRTELIKIVVWRLSRHTIDADFLRCLEALRTLFREDEDGQATLDAVTLLSKMMRARDFNVDESVIGLFLSLRLLNEFSGKGSQDAVDLPKKDGNGDGSEGMSNKTMKRFLTKKERKQRKEQKALDKEMAQADALVSHQERERMQSETLKMVFATYFRILKQRTPHLMGAVLEGLTLYAHLINQDFFGDLLEALKDLIRYSNQDQALYNTVHETEEGEEQEEDEEDLEKTNVVRNPNREALLCTTTAFTLLAGQDAHSAQADLHLDLSFFVTHLYQSLLSLSVYPDLERTAHTHAFDPQDPSFKSDAAAAAAAAQLRSTSRNKVNIQTMTVLLVRSLTASLLPTWNIRSVPPLQLAAFTKQLLTASLHMPEKSIRAILALLADVVDTHARKISSLWNTDERKGDGHFQPLSDTLSGANPLAATVWEGELLRLHFSPHVREGVKLMEKTLVQELNKR